MAATFSAFGLTFPVCRLAEWNSPIRIAWCRRHFASWRICVPFENVAAGTTTKKVHAMAIPAAPAPRFKPRPAHAAARDPGYTAPTRRSPMTPSTLAPLLLLAALGCGSPTASDTADTSATTDTSDTADTSDTGDTSDTAADACADPTDTASSRVDTPATFTDDDDTCDRRWDEQDLAGWPGGGGCGWGYVWLRDDHRVMTLELELPAADKEADHDWSYRFVPGHGATLQLLDDRSGTDAFDFWSCSDYSEHTTGTVWTAVAGHIEVESRWICDTTDPSCGFAETELHAEVRLVDIGLENTAGECEELADVTLRVPLGLSECGG